MDTPAHSLLTKAICDILETDARQVRIVDDASEGKLFENKFEKPK
jgi:hypothetical protein